MASEDDTAYKQLFAYPEMVRDLLLGFVPGEWVYIYLLLEFQSRSDHWMALRMQVYVGLLYQELVKRHELPQPGRLPPIFPVVLYNGAKPWSACCDLAELVLPGHPDLAYLQPSQRYLLIDQRRLDSHALDCGANFLAAVFRAERLSTTEGCADEARHWYLLSASGAGTGFTQSFNRWIARRLQQMAGRRKLNLQGLVVKEETMSIPYFNTVMDALRYETQLVGQRKQLQRLLIRRFGSLPRQLKRRIDYAEMDDLDRWLDRVFDAQNVKEIFVETQPA